MALLGFLESASLRRGETENLPTTHGKIRKVFLPKSRSESTEKVESETLEGRRISIFNKV
jgi:hypothetical protein